MPAVVNISTTIRFDDDRSPLFKDPFFRQFNPRRRQQSSSLGSGVIVDADKGYILTNHHVIEGADEITITTNDGREIEAELVGSDAGSDVAVIQVKNEGLHAVKLGRSGDLRVGDFVVAIGSPFGLNQSVTSGIVSGLGRTGLGIEGYEDFIQTDASINPGNSGGALVNLRGELIGINTAIFSRGGGSVGIGFSIPIDMAGTLMSQLVKFGDIQRGLLGVAMQDLTPQLAEAFNLKGKNGAVVSEVIEGSAAAEIGMTSGDVIVGFNEYAVENGADLRNAVGLLRAGETGVVQYYRNGELKINEVKIRGADEIANLQAEKALNERLQGAAFENVSAWGGRQRGVRIESIEANSPVSETGLKQGDVIVSVNNNRVASIDELGQVTAREQGALLIRIIRDGRTIALIVQ